MPQLSMPAICQRDEALQRQKTLIKELGVAPTKNQCTRIILQHETESSLLPQVELNKENISTLADLEQLQSTKSSYEKGESLILKGKFLLCRSIAPMTRNQVDIVGLVVDDPSGRLAVQVAVHNLGVMLPTGSGYPCYAVNDSVPIGSVLAIMNPTLRCMSDSGEIKSIHVQNPAHFIFLGREHPIVREFPFKADLSYPNEFPLFDLVDLNKAGVQYHVRRHFHMAIECFTQALARPVSDVKMIYGNRSAAYLALEKYDLALEDAGKGLELDSKATKLLLRKAKALFFLKRYQECADFIERNPVEEAATVLPEYKLIENSVKIAKEEAVNGQYLPATMRQEYKTKFTPYLEMHAEYFAKESIEERDSGLYAIQDIDKGTLLAAHRALAFYPSRERDQSRGYELASMICAKMALEPEFCRAELRKLSGGHLSVPKCDGSTRDDIKDLLQLIRSNMFLVTKGESGAEMEPLGSGVWSLAALVANSCVDANVHMTHVGAFCFIRTIRPIKAGEQLLVCRFPPSMAPFERRSEHFAQLGFSCKCRLCEIERSESKENKVKFGELMKKYLMDPPGNDAAALEKLVSTDLPEAIKEAELLRQPRELNMVAHQLKMNLARWYGKLGKLDEAAKILEEIAVEYAKVSLIGEECMCAEWLQQIYASLEKKEEAAMWEKRLIENITLMGNAH